MQATVAHRLLHVEPAIGLTLEGLTQNHKASVQFFGHQRLDECDEPIGTLVP